MKEYDFYYDGRGNRFFQIFMEDEIHVLLKVTDDELEALAETVKEATDEGENDE
jgi:uncharacterized protein involved in tolerance to divalent cations